MNNNKQCYAVRLIHFGQCIEINQGEFLYCVLFGVYLWYKYAGRGKAVWTKNVVLRDTVLGDFKNVLNNKSN